MNLSSHIEAILFFKGEPVSQKTLAKLLNATPEHVEAGIAQLKKDLEGRALTIIVKDDEYLLSTGPTVAPLIETIVKDELNRDLGKAGLETLSIVIYQGPVSRREIDYIRGVNSQFILRNLLVRGLIEKISSETDQRSFLYKPSFELLSYLGVSDIKDLPEYESARAALIESLKKKEDEQSHE